MTTAYKIQLHSGQQITFMGAMENAEWELFLCAVIETVRSTGLYSGRTIDVSSSRLVLFDSVHQTSNIGVLWWVELRYAWLRINQCYCNDKARTEVSRNTNLPGTWWRIVCLVAMYRPFLLFWLLLMNIGLCLVLLYWITDRGLYRCIELRTDDCTAILN